MPDISVWMLLMVAAPLLVVVLLVLSRGKRGARIALLALGAALVIAYLIWNLAGRPGV